MRVHTKKRWGWRQLALVVAAVGVGLLAFCWTRFRAHSQSAAAPPRPLPPVEAAPAPPAAASADPRAAVAYVHRTQAVTREDLGEYLIARLGAERLETLVNTRIIEHACRQQGVTVTAAEVEASLREDLKNLGGISPKEFVDRVLKQYGVNLVEWKEDRLRPHLLMTKLCRDRVRAGEDDVRKAYESLFGPKVECQLITWNKDERAKAQEESARARASREEFDRLAKQGSGPYAATGGRIRPFGRHTLGNEALEKVAFALHPGQVSDLIDSPDGLLLIKCLAVVPPTNPPRFEDVRKDLEKEAFERKLKAEIDATFRELRRQADPKLILTPSQDGVAPPAAAVVPGDYAQRVVAYVHGAPVTRQDLGEYLIARFGAERLELLVNKVVMEDACRKQGVEVSAAEVDAALQVHLQAQNIPGPAEFDRRLRKEYRTSLYEWKEDVIRVRLLMAKMCRGRVKATEEDFRKAFEAYHGEKVQCRMILWPKAEAKRAMVDYPKLRDNPAEFDRVAATQASPTLARSRGEIPPIARNTTGIDRLEDEAFKLKEPGELSPLIETPEGVAVLKCVARVPAEKKDLEDVRAGLEREIVEKKVAAEIPVVMEELRKIADPKLLLKKYTTDEDLKRAAEEEIKQNEPSPKP